MKRTPGPCPVVLGLDQAARSGWAIAVSHDHIASSGAASTCAERFAVVQLSLELARQRGAGLVVYFEDHADIPARKGRGTETVLGIGAARGRWEEQLEMNGSQRKRWHRVSPRDWRKAILSLPARAREKTCKAAAMGTVGQFMRPRRAVVDDPDEAEAMAIAIFGYRMQALCTATGVSAPARTRARKRRAGGKACRTR